MVPISVDFCLLRGLLQKQRAQAIDQDLPRGNTAATVQKTKAMKTPITMYSRTLTPTLPDSQPAARKG